MNEQKVLFGIGLGAWNGAAVADVAQILDLAGQADRQGLDLFTLADHPYLGERLDAYATLGFVLGHSKRLYGVVTVTNLPSRPAPILARTITSLFALSGGRVVLGIGAGGLWDEIVKLGVSRLGPGSAVRAMGEAIKVVRALSGGGDPVTFDGEFYQVSGVDPAPVGPPAIWTGAIGPKSLAVTGRLADGWIPGHASDWISETYRHSRPIIDDAAVAAGRDPAEIATIYNIVGRITPGPLPATRDEGGRWVGGSVDQWVEEMTNAVVEHHAAGFVFHSADDLPVDTAVGRFAEEIVPAVRDALS